MELRVPHVLDTSVALIVEGYQSLGMDWWTALETAQEAGRRKVPESASGETVQPARREKTEEEKVAENNAVLASIMGGLGQSTFKGKKG